MATRLVFIDAAFGFTSPTTPRRIHHAFDHALQRLVEEGGVEALRLHEVAAEGVVRAGLKRMNSAMPPSLLRRAHADASEDDETNASGGLSAGASCWFGGLHTDTFKALDPHESSPNSTFVSSDQILGVKEATV